MRYCNPTTLSQPASYTYPNCLEDINNVILREGYSGAVPFFTNTEVVINGDILEIEITRAQNKINLDSSMDVAFGISDSTNAELVLVELRLNYSNPNNVSGSKLYQKLHGTINAICPTVPIHNKIIFLFDTSVKAEATNRLARMDPKLPRSFVVMDLPELKSLYF